MLKRGDEVVMTDKAIKQSLQGRTNRRFGIVYSYRPPYVTVFRRGSKAKQAQTYHETFWSLASRRDSRGHFTKKDSQADEGRPRNG